MSILRTAVVLVTAVVLAGAPESVLAQSSPTVPSNAPTEETIGVPSTAAKVDPSLIVMNTGGAILDANKHPVRSSSPTARRGLQGMR
jgi:hypothetical protein